MFIIDLSQTNLEGKNSIIAALHPMTFPKYKHSMIGYNDIIYIVGGENNDIVLSYHIKENTCLNPLIKKRS